LKRDDYLAGENQGLEYWIWLWIWSGWGRR